MALVANVAASNADSFVSVAYANTYFNSHWSLAKTEAWNALSTPQKERVLKTATNILESLRFLDSDAGGPGITGLVVSSADAVTIRQYDAAQSLSFPRNVDVDADGVPFIPAPIADATCEQGVYLLTFDESVLATQYQGIVEESVVAGPVRSYANYGRLGTMLSPIAAELVRPYLRPTRRMRRA